MKMRIVPRPEDVLLVLVAAGGCGVDAQNGVDGRAVVVSSSAVVIGLSAVVINSSIESIFLAFITRIHPTHYHYHYHYNSINLQGNEERHEDGSISI